LLLHVCLFRGICVVISVCGDTKEVSDHARTEWVRAPVFGVGHQGIARVKHAVIDIELGEYVGIGFRVGRRKRKRAALKLLLNV
jgi:hypothetical protein